MTLSSDPHGTGEPLPSAPAWRREPYRLLFPLGAVLAWAGVGHWLAFALQWSPEWRPVFHSIAQIQGFLACFAVGFLLTAIPRRTQTPPPSAVEMALCLVCPVATTAAAWLERFALSQVFWIALLATLLAFALRRFRARDAGRRPPDSFVWVPMSLAMGVAGAVLIGLYGALGLGFGWHQLGRLLVLQGVFLGLVVGVGGMVLPLITCGDAPPDASPGSARRRWWHVAAAALLVATFVLEVLVPGPAAHAARAALVLAVLLLGAHIHRRPRRTGFHRWLVWWSAWAIPAGYLLAALLPAHAQVGLHVVFVTGFALMALSVGLHVTFAHGGRQDLASGRPWAVPVAGGLLLVAAASRALLNLDPARTRLWLGVASGAFLLGTLVWLGLVASTYVRWAPPAGAGVTPSGSSRDPTRGTSGSPSPRR